MLGMTLRRITSVFTKSPINCSSCRSRRFAIGEPTRMSSSPLYRASKTPNAANNVMYRVEWLLWLN